MRPSPGPASPPRTASLAEAADAVAALAATAGADAVAARQEALVLAAAVAESAPGAAADWGAAVGGASTQDFFDAASRGRRWRGAPTAILGMLAAQQSPHALAYAQALAEVAAAACELGEPTMRVVGNASVAAAAQLSAVRPEAAGALRAGEVMDSWPGGTQPHLTGIPGMGGIPNAVSTPDSTQPPPAAPPTAPPPASPRTLEELLAELDGLI
ncbi:MAG: AAA family ATPase, partial [Ornithinibacter sp.]